MNATATTYTADQAFAALAALKSAKAKYDAIASKDGLGGYRHCPDAKVAAEYHAAGQRLFEVADYFFATLTGFKTLNECLEAQANGYRPTFREDGGKDRETVFLAETYDYLAETRGLPLRAYRPEQAALLPAGIPEVPPCVLNHVPFRGRSGKWYADKVIDLASTNGLYGAIRTALDAINAIDKQDCRDWFGAVADSLKEQFDRDRPSRLSIQWIKQRCHDLREIANAEAKTVDVKYLRSRGYDYHAIGEGGVIDSTGPGSKEPTLRLLKDLASRGTEVEISGGFDGSDDFGFGDYEPLVAEWSLTLKSEDILNARRGGF